MKVLAKGEGGVTLLEVVVASAILGLFSIFAFQVVLNGEAMGKGTVKRHAADSVVNRMRNLVLLRWEQQSGVTIDPIFSLMRETTQGHSQRLTIGTACKPMPTVLKGKKIELEKVYSHIPPAGGRGSLCRRAARKWIADTCPPDHRPVMVVFHHLLDGKGKSVQPARIEEFPGPNATGGDGPIAGGFCVVDTGGKEKRAVFSQVIRENDRYVFREADVSLVGKPAAKFAADLP